MSEILNQNDQQKAARFYEEHRIKVGSVDHFQQELDTIKARQTQREEALAGKPLLRHPLKNFTGMDRKANKDAAEHRVIRKLLDTAVTERDANLWQSHQHVQEHLDQYIETARQEAEAQGTHINLEQPKE